MTAPFVASDNEQQAPVNPTHSRDDDPSLDQDGLRSSVSDRKDPPEHGSLNRRIVHRTAPNYDDENQRARDSTTSETESAKAADVAEPGDTAALSAVTKSASASTREARSNDTPSTTSLSPLEQQIRHRRQQSLTASMKKEREALPNNLNSTASVATASLPSGNNIGIRLEPYNRKSMTNNSSTLSNSNSAVRVEPFDHKSLSSHGNAAADAKVPTFTPDGKMSGKASSVKAPSSNAATPSTSVIHDDDSDQKEKRSYAVRSIPKGSAEWTNLLKPFVSDLAFRSVVSRRYQGDISYRPYNCQAALLFVDMSGYSKITAAIAHRGAHVMSSVVNAYLERLLHIIHRHGGDVFKFAGDAILVVWEGDEQDLEINVLCAARCVLELQNKVGEHSVEGTSHTFRIHCGLCCGPLESEIFEAPTHANMQRLYHSVGGEVMAEIGDLVDLSKAGETCVSRNCFNFLEDVGHYQDLEDCGPAYGAKLLTDLSLEDDLVQLMDQHIVNSLVDRQARRNKSIEEDFIHSSVLASLSHGGLSPTQIAEMRNLCVLFIAMTSNGSSVNWLMEVQAILDRSRCPIVQIIDDDKGVHIVAAVNLYEAVPEMSLLGLEVCRELVVKRVGATVGVAIGPTFCGVTGSTTACRWDITGPAVVRAARLMQYALTKRVDFAIDQTVYDDPMAATHMSVLDTSVSLKGTAAPITVYTISDSKVYSAFRILENVHGGVHNTKVQAIQNHIGGDRDRSAVVVTGIPLAGKKIACQRAAGLSDLVPFRHLCEESAGFLQLARTIATWFQYVEDMDVRMIASRVVDDMDHGRWSCAHDQCIDLVNRAIGKGFRACFLVDRIQFLDKFSISLIRECLRKTRHRFSSMKVSMSVNSQTPSLDSNDSEEWDAYFSEKATGKICFLCVHVSLYSGKSASDIVQDITRSHTSFSVPIFEIGEATLDELRTLFRDLWDMEVEDRWLEAYAEASGYCAGYFIERAAAVRNLSGQVWKEGKSALAETSKELVLHIPPGLVRKNKELPVTQIRPEIAMRFSQVYDELPPLCQMLLKTLTVATRRGFYKLPRKILWQVMNDLIANGVEQNVFAMILEEMVEICLVKLELEFADDNDGDDNASEEYKVISIQSPALADVAMDVCTPVQVRSIAAALIDRLGATLTHNFQVSLVLASLHKLLGQNEDMMKHLWLQAYDGFLQERETCRWPKREIDRWAEIIDDEIQAAGFNASDILGVGFSVPVEPRQAISPCLSMLKVYSAPVSLGPMGHTLSVICRNTFHEFGAFHGASQEATDKVRGTTASACGRYMMEMTVVEDYLRENGFPAPGGKLETEFDLISFIANPSGNEEEVETKAVIIYEEIIPQHVEPRLQRLYKLVSKLRQDEEAPAVFFCAPEPIRLAYNALQAEKRQKCRTDAAQDALMILATMNWKPKPVPEYLPLLHYQTVANLRNKTLKRLNENEMVMFRHQQTVDDLEAFLIVTPLLYQASEQGIC